MRHQRRRPQRRDNRHKYIFGRFIREERVVVIDDNKENLGVIETREGLRIARDAGLELVLVSQGKNGKPSICKVLDLGKYKYDQDQREKAASKKQRENSVKIKEIKFRPSTGENDLQNKARQMQEFVDNGNRLKVTVMFRGRELAHKDIGFETMKRFAEMMSGKYDAYPTMSGRAMTAIMVKKDEDK